MTSRIRYGNTDNSEEKTIKIPINNENNNEDNKNGSQIKKEKKNNKKTI